jgi:cellulose synthase/poly-beta-1,6-N-acetylglucosamine synthase-like glycosyltransferase
MQKRLKITHQTGENAVNKSPLMVIMIFLLWSTSLAIYGPRLINTINSGQNFFQIILLFLFSVMLILFWLLAAYFISVLIFSFFSKSVTQPESEKIGKFPKIAILYPTCNDFQKEAALTCLCQDYPDFHLFLLDDSYNEDYRIKVDAFHDQYPEKTTIIRRPDRKGFKAGNLNNALNTTIVDFPFFAVVDADERLPLDFLKRTVVHMRNPSIAFVQANHLPCPEQITSFARDISPTILPFWQIHCKTRNKFGFVAFIGHGALIRRSSWKSVNGFPEVITEDLAFSIELRKKGMQGIFLEDLYCFEDFPSTYIAFKKQQERYIIGTTQVILKNIKSVFSNNKIGFIEKFDFFMWCTPLYIPPLALVFLLLNCFGLTFAFGTWVMSTVTIFGQEFHFHQIRMTDTPYSQLYSLDFQIFSVICAFSSAFGCIALGFMKKLNALKLLFLSTATYFSLMFITWRGILGYLFNGRVLFPPTGDQALISNLNVKNISQEFTQNTNKWHTPKYWEIFSGILLAVVSLLSFNFGLFALSSCLLIGVGIEEFGWENKFVQFSIKSCFVLILSQILLSIMVINSSPWITPLVFSVHF